jgi:hypothetical protein
MMAFPAPLMNAEIGKLKEKGLLPTETKNPFCKSLTPEP